MRILHTVEFYQPSVGGAQEVVRQLSERLAHRGHEVHVATTWLPDRQFTSLNGVHLHGFKISGNDVQGYRGDIQQYLDFLRLSDYDVILSYAAQQWTFDLLKRLLPSLRAPVIFVPCGYSGLHDPAYAEYFRALPSYLEQMDACVYLSEEYQDAVFAREHGLLNGVLIPNGAGEEFLEPSRKGNFREHIGAAERDLVCLCVGNYGKAKGQDRVLDAFARAHIANGVLAFIGSKFPPLTSRFAIACVLRAAAMRLGARQKRVVFLEGLDRTATVDAFCTSDLFLFGSRVECSPLVLYEACAAGLPFISTDCGNAQEIARWTGGGIVVWERDFKDAIERLARDSAERQRLALAGRAAYQSRFNWAKIADLYEQLYFAVSKGT